MNPRPTLADRCLIHSHKMYGEGHYVTANVLADAEILLVKAERALRPFANAVFDDGRKITPQVVTLAEWANARRAYLDLTLAS